MRTQGWVGSRVRGGCWGESRMSGTNQASLVAQLVETLPAMWETWVRSRSQEDPLEEEMATRSSVLARIPRTEEPGRLQSLGLQRAGHA